MKSNNINKYIIGSILPIIILISMTILPLTTYIKGEDILIKTKPYDPRDVFRGDYVALNYDINEIDINKVPKEFLKANEYDVERKLRNKKLYVVLKKVGQYYEVDYATFKKPKKKLFLNAKFDYMVWNWEDVKKENEKGTERIIGIRVNYNLDKYFIPENTGKSLEELSRKGALTAKIKVYKGYSLLVNIS